MVVVTRKHELDTGCYWQLCVIPIQRFRHLTAAYGGVFIVIALIWGWIIGAPDVFDEIGAIIVLASYYLHASKR
jgi:drug/metabolite transporter superfamily protein YnfA